MNVTDTIYPTSGELVLCLADGAPEFTCEKGVKAVVERQDQHRAVVRINGPAGHLHLSDRGKHRFQLAMGDAAKVAEPTADERRFLRERVREALREVESSSALAGLPELAVYSRQAIADLDATSIREKVSGDGQLLRL